MHLGATLGRRFTLVSAEEYDLPGVRRFLANDARLNKEVTVDVVTAAAPSTVRRVASKAALVRDPRLTRIITTGRDRDGDHVVTYVVSERTAGTRLSEVLAERVLSPIVAGAIAGDVARALTIAAAQGLHHGHVRGECLTITPHARVVIAGLGVDAELATQAELDHHHAPLERADAVDLARLYLSAITGKAAADVTLDDLPPGLTSNATALCAAFIKGSGPHSLDDVVKALSPFTAQALHGFSAGVAQLPWRPHLIAERVAEAAARMDALGGSFTVDPAAVAAASRLVDWHEAEEATVEEISSSLSGTSPIPDTASVEPFDNDDFTNLHNLEIITADQNAEIEPAVWEEVLEGLHQQWPQSERITESLSRAHKRAQRPAPIKAGPLWMAIGVAVVVIATIVGLSLLSQPFVPENVKPDPSPVYPPFTFMPEPAPSVSTGTE